MLERKAGLARYAPFCATVVLVVLCLTEVTTAYTNLGRLTRS